MKRLTSFLFTIRYALALFGILVFAWLTRVYQLDFPSGYVFDETYHVPAIRLMAERDQRVFEWWHPPVYSLNNYDWLHPPLAKYIQAFAVTALGQDAFGWRISSAVFGVIGVSLVFVVTQLAFKNQKVSLLASFLLAVDGLWLVQSRIAMNDVFVTVWLLLAIAVYFWYQRTRSLSLFLLVGFAFGLGIATKWSAIFWLFGLFFWELIGKVQRKRFHQLPWLCFSLLIVPGLVYLASYLPMFLQGKDFSYFIELHRNIVRYQFLNGNSHPYQSVPWQWLLNIRPVWYWTASPIQNIYAFSNPLLSWMGLLAIIFTTARVLLRGQTRQDGGERKLSLFVVLLAVTILPWMSIPRITFYYHYTPAIPLVAILLAYWLHEFYLKNSQQLKKILLFLVLASLVWTFWAYYPHWVGFPVSKELSEAVYFALPTWR